VVTGAEISTIAKAGSDVTKGVRSALAQPPIKWPNAHEALMELYIILDDWCEAASESNEAARVALDARLGDEELPDLRVVAQMAAPMPLYIAPGYVERIARDADGVLSPRAPGPAGGAGHRTAPRHVAPSVACCGSTAPASWRPTRRQ